MTDPTDETKGDGYTYFIQAETGGPVKIGRSTTERGVELRRLGCQTGNPATLVVRRVLEGRLHEGELHRRFQHLRISGEWFICDEELARVAHALPQADLSQLRDSAAYTLGFKNGWRAGMDEAHEELFRRLNALQQSMLEAHEDLRTDNETDAVRALKRTPTAHGLHTEGLKNAA